MPREKFKTLTEQMYYILLCLCRECCGMDIMDQIPRMTGGRVKVGSGTLYNLLEQFLAEGMIRQTRAEGRRRSYILTPLGRQALEEEYARQQEAALETGIEEELASYIWDKAQALGLSCQVCVTVETGADGIPVPRSVTVTGAYSEDLSEIIETDLGIPREQQNWQEAS